MNTLFNLIKRILAVVLCAFVFITYIPGMAYALKEQSGEIPAVGETHDTEEEVNSEVPQETTKNETLTECFANEPGTVIEESHGLEADEESGSTNAVYSQKVGNLADPDELLEAFMEKQISEKAVKSETKATRNNRYSALTEDEKEVYRALKEEIEAVVSGDGENHYSEMSVEGHLDPDSMSDWDSAFKVVDALMVDMPYEFFWYDKTSGVNIMTTGDSIIYIFSVIKEYRSDEVAWFENEEIPVYKLINIDVPSRAASFARSIVDNDNSDSDIGRLTAYKDAVCELTEYNDDAASEDYEGGYGDPWQMIYVFDQEPDTNVVCEGYSKAFQYLCDYAQNTDRFDSDEIECHSVTGFLSGEDATGAGRHMWNILHMDDHQNYMADITCSDEGKIGQDGGLFISPALEGGSVDNKFQYDVDDDSIADVTYSYSKETFELYEKNELEMSTTEYGVAESETLSSVWFDGVKNGDGEDEEWAHFYPVNGQDGTLALENMNVAVKDENGNVIDPANYEIQVVHTYWDGDTEVEEPVDGTTYGLDQADKTEDAGFTEYRLVAIAAEDSGYSGEVSGTFYIVDKYSLNFICSDISFDNADWSGDWRMHQYFKFGGEPCDPSVTLSVFSGDEAILQPGRDYKVTYYYRGDDPDDWNEYFSTELPVLDENDQPCVPHENGEYFARVEGQGNYYGGNDVLIDIGRLFINGDGSPDLWSDQDKDFTITKTDALEGEIKFRIGINSNADDGSWDDPEDVILSEGTHYSWDSESGRLTLFGGNIYEVTGEQNVEIFAYVDNEDYEENDPASSPYLATAWTSLMVRGARVDYDREWDRDMLPGWDGDISGHYGVQTQNSEYPDGWWTEYDVTNVEVISDENNLLSDFFRDSDDNDEESYWWHYEIKEADYLNGARGTVTFEVTYRDIDGNEDQYTFDVNVVDDVYEAWFQPVDGSYKALPGGSIELKADGNHKYCRFEKNEDDPDDQGHWENYENDEGIAYGWKIEQGDEFATLEVSDTDPSCAVLRFNPADAPEDYWGETEVSISVGPANDQLTFRESKRFFVEDQYYEIWPVRNNADLDIEDSETIDFELRHYMLGSDYTVVDQETDVQYSYEGDGRVTAVQDEGDDSIFTFTRNSNDDIDFEIEASWDSEYGPREERGGFGYNRKDYDVWFEHEGDRAYTDGTFDYVLNMDRLGSDWRDHYDIVFKVGQREWNEETQTPEWVNVFSNTLQYTIVDGNIVRLNGPMLKTHTGEGIDIHAEVKLKGKDITVCEADDWAEVAEAWEEHDFPGYYDESTDEFKPEITLLRGWDEYIGRHVGYWGGNAENPDYWGNFLVSNVTVTNGDSVVVEPDEEGDGWSLRPEKLGDSTVSIEFTDQDGFSTMKSPYVFTVHVENDFFDASIDSTDGKFRVGPGESINLRAYALHKYTIDTEDGNSWIYEEDQDGLSYEWVLEDDGLASLVQDPEDPSKAVLTFKSAEELGNRRDGTRVTVKVKYNGKVVAENFDYYAVLDEYAWIQPRTIDPDIDYKDTVEIDLETWFKENNADARKIPGDISYTWSFNNNDVIIERGILAEGEDTGYSYEGMWDNETTESNHFRITRKTDRYTRIVLRAEWGMDQSVWHAFYFDPKSYEIRLNGYDDEEPAIIEGEEKTFSYTAAGFSGDTTFDAFIVTWDEKQQDWADVEGLPEDAVTVAPSEGGFTVTLSAAVAGELIGRNIHMFNISTWAYKNGNAIWVEESRPISVISDAEGLEAAKAAAIAELTGINTSAYSGNEKTNVEKAITDGIAVIEAAATIDAVNAAKTTAFNTINAQKTDAQKAAEANSNTTVNSPSEIMDLPIVKISKPKAAKKKITVKWKKVSKKNLKKISGIQIQVSTDPNFSTILKTVPAGKKKTSKVIKGLQSKTTYYVRIRACAAGNHVSDWRSSKAKVK